MSLKPRLVPLSVRVTDLHAVWLDRRALKMRRSTGEVLRMLLDEIMARDDVHNGTQQARNPSK